MSENHTWNAAPSSASARPELGSKHSKKTTLAVDILIVGGLIFAGVNLFADVEESGQAVTSYFPFVLLGPALVIALTFEFVNGFHDTVNAVATVIYTHSLTPGIAFFWSGLCMLSSGAVAFGIISLLPMELMLQANSGNGFAMIYALLFSALIWDLGTWYLDLPSSSSYTLTGSIIGVGVANAIKHGRSGLEGVNWDQALNIAYALLFSTLVGFFSAALLLAMKKWLRNYSRFNFWRCRRYGSQSFRPANCHAAQSVDRLGADAADLDLKLRPAVYAAYLSQRSGNVLSDVGFR